MSLEEDILIEQFLKGALSKEDEVAFFKRMHDDVKFKEKVALEKQLRESLSEDDWSFAKDTSPEIEAYNETYKSKEIQQLKDVIQNAGNSYQEPKKTTSRKWFLYASAAVIALLVSLYVFQPSATPQELYATYFEDTTLPSFISREDSNENQLIRAQQFFEDKDYEKALVIFKQELKNASTPEAALYLYTGIAQMELNEFEAAEKTFDTLIHSNLIDASKGVWYKALLFLKTDNIEKSKLLLEKISREKLFNAVKAKELLKKFS